MLQRAGHNAYEDYLTRGNVRVTARLPSEPVRVTSWLAGWMDYVFATVLVASRWLCSPLLRAVPQRRFEPAYAEAMANGTAQVRPITNDQGQSGRVVKAAEIAMLTLAFFLGTHLLTGGTPSAAAPNPNPLGLLPAHADAVEAGTIRAVQREVTVRADSFDAATRAATPAAGTIEPASGAPTEEAILAPAPAAAVQAAALPAATPAPAATVAAASPPEPTPAATVAPAPAATTAAVGWVLSEGEVRAAALAAGWAPELLDQVVKVAWCESRFNSAAEYLGARGLMQILVNYWFEPYGLDPAQWQDPVTNLTAARYAYDANHRVSGDGWAAWTCKP